MLRPRLANLTRRIFLDYRGHRLRSVGRESFFRLARRFTATIEASYEDLRFEVPTYDRAVGLRTFVDGPPERYEFQAALRLLDDIGVLNSESLRTFLEVGANLGTATVLALKRFGFSSAYCFEPMPQNVTLLTRNLELNDLTNQVTLFDCALSATDGSVVFELSPDNSGDGRIRYEATSGAFSEELRSTVSVQSRRLDTLIDNSSVDLRQVDLAWIDAQGSEASILLGARHLLSSSIPIFMEFWPYGIGRAGGSEALRSAINDNYTSIYDLNSLDDPKEYSASDIDFLLDSYSRTSLFDPTSAHSSTNLVLI